MRIIADENIPFVREAFAELGEVETFAGRAISPDVVRNADILLVRSVTKVNSELLEGSSVRFVATATIGTDHVDELYLQRRGIGFASAKGSNANSVAEYVFAALLNLAVRYNWKLAEKTLGVIGVGNIGSRVVRIAQGLGMEVLQNDPPLARQTADPRFLPLETLMNADILTLHVPLTYEGEDATYHLFDEAKFRQMQPATVLFNTSRGAVVDNQALKGILATGQLAAVVLDVWENEPHIDGELLRMVTIGTPHIAGYSLDGKVNGTRMIYEAVCNFLDVKPTWNPSGQLPPPKISEIRINGNALRSDEEALNTVVQQAYPIEKDDARLRAMLKIPPEQWGTYFDSLRKNYPVRREFFNIKVRVNNYSSSLIEKLKVLGFMAEE